VSCVMLGDIVDGLTTLFVLDLPKIEDEEMNEWWMKKKKKKKSCHGRSFIIFLKFYVASVRVGRSVAK
jgi:hypothetical protein